jgi:phosphotransacetylase
MLEGGRDHINDIVEFFKTYHPHPGLNFNKRAWKDGKQADINKEREKEMKLIKDMMKEKMEKIMNKQGTCVDEVDNTLNLDDPDFEKVPFMDPEYTNHTFKEWFKILYSVCDPKGLTDDQCVEVMENCMGGSYLTEIQEMKTRKYSLKKIQKHFVDKDIIKDPGYTFDLDDPDFKKVPLMDPENKMHNFEEWFEILYSICDPKGLTDDQCVDVMEVCMVGLYNTELQDMKTKKYSLGMIEKHFLRKDIILDPGYSFDENDTDFKKIPCMHPNKTENTFKDFFESLYSVCDPKGFTDEQCKDVMEIRMGDTYLDELKELENNSADLETIELHFLAKDSQKENKVK